MFHKINDNKIAIQRSKIIGKILPDNAFYIATVSLQRLFLYFLGHHKKGFNIERFLHQSYLCNVHLILPLGTYMFLKLKCYKSYLQTVI